MSSLMLLVNANVDSSQLISILSAALPSSDDTKHSRSTYNLLKLVHYDAVATVLCQCHDQGSNTSSNKTLSSRFASYSNNNRRNSNSKTQHTRVKKTSEKFDELKTRKQVSDAETSITGLVAIIMMELFVM